MDSGCQVDGWNTRGRSLDGKTKDNVGYGGGGGGWGAWVNGEGGGLGGRGGGGPRF